jgi:hypothetical protein
MTLKVLLALAALAVALGIGASFLVMSVTTPRSLARAHANLQEDRTPENLAAWEWERTTGAYIHQAKLAAILSIVSFIVLFISHLMLEVRKRRA